MNAQFQVQHLEPKTTQNRLAAFGLLTSVSKL